MADAKIQIKVGGIEFTGEGEKDWIAKQLDKILEKAPHLMKIIPKNIFETDESGEHEMGVDPVIAKKPLATFLREKKATSNQVKKFLATAVWLEAKGQTRLKTTDVTKALKNNNQSGLTNPSSCLNKNVSKGYCEKDKRQFFVTEEGKNSL